MNNELPADIRRIIAAQTSNKLPTLGSLPVLPKIGASSANKSPNEFHSVATSSFDKVIDERSSREDGQSWCIEHDEIKNKFKRNYPFDLKHEKMGPTHSTAHDHRGNVLSACSFSRLDDFDRSSVILKKPPLPPINPISRLDLSLATIPASLPTDIAGLQSAVDNLSDKWVKSILDACRLYDRELRRYLCVPSLIKCFGEVIPSVHSPSSPWRKFLQQLAPRGEFIEYEKVLELISKSKKTEEDRETIIGPGVVFQTIELSELNMLLEMYGLEAAFQPIHQRLFSCFLTHDNKFHFSAFVACLSLCRLPARHIASVAATSEPRTSPTLPHSDAESNHQSTLDNWLPIEKRQ
uniref:Ras-GEF domain-containing protein n=1 Tax=Angiostrongylus cantonensis TaxID=6313 RepID=A0A0K0DN57_ANGCA